MRVLQLGPYPPPNGGVQTNLVAIRQLLERRGHHCSVIAITRTSQTAGVPDTYKPNTAFELLKLLFGLKYDLLHFHLGGTVPLRVALMMLACTLVPFRKSVLTIHSGGFPSSSEGKKAGFWTVHGFVFRRFNCIIGVNEDILQTMRKFGVKNRNLKLVLPFVLSNPPDAPLSDEIDKFVKNHSPLLLSVGLLEKHYAKDLQIDAMEQILQKFPNAGLLQIGSGSEEGFLHRCIRSKSYAEHILLTGDVPHETTLQLIEKADVLLRTTFYDGDAVSVREALFLGTPVIATDNKMRPAGVHLIPAPPEIEPLCTAIEEQVKLGKLTHQENVNGWEHIEAILDIYQKLCPENVEKAEEIKTSQSRRNV